MELEMMSFYKTAVFLSYLLINVAFAQQSKVLIVNTDSGVAKYGKIATEFKNKFQKNTYQWLEFDLKGQDASENTDLQKIIQKEAPEFIYCIGSKAYSLSQSYATNETLLFSAAINWQKLNINDKTYGISNELAPEQEITFIKMFFPTVKKIGLLYSKDTKEYIKTLKNDAEILNMEIIEQQIDNVAEIDSELSELLPKIDLFWLISDPGILNNKESVMKIFQMAKQKQKPVYAYNNVFIKYGAVLSVSPDPVTIGRQSANLMMSLKETNLPAKAVQFPAGSNISLNMCTIETLKMNLNSEALDSVNEFVRCGQQ